MKKELEKLEFAEGYSKIGELKEGLEKFFFLWKQYDSVLYLEQQTNWNLRRRYNA